jgi:16S rRNA (adenine1518-N6/adenine1519-N6)-dimethyltransferase
MTDFVTPEKSLLAQTREWLQQYDLHARKGLGQHFLVNPGVLKNIIQSAELSAEDVVLEIGPGLGVLTRELVNQAGWVIAIELDSKLCEMLRQTFASCPNISIINHDILNIEPLEIIQQEKAKFPSTLTFPQYKLVANLPYYITAPIIRHFCEARIKPQMMVIMVQKEVAKNIVAQPGDMGILAISVQFYGKPQIAGYVPAGNFYPAPKVDSAILKINLYPKPPFEVTSEHSFFEIVRAGFCAARKQIGNSLAQGLDMPKPEVLCLLDKAGVKPQKRAETLSLEEWARMERIFSEARRRDDKSTKT